MYNTLEYGNIHDQFHCVKSVQITNFFWFEYGKIRTRKNYVFGHFSHSVHFQEYNDQKKSVFFRVSARTYFVKYTCLWDFFWLLHFCKSLFSPDPEIYTDQRRQATKMEVLRI